MQLPAHFLIKGKLYVVWHVTTSWWSAAPTAQGNRSSKFQQADNVFKCSGCILSCNVRTIILIYPIRIQETLEARSITPDWLRRQVEYRISIRNDSRKVGRRQIPRLEFRYHDDVALMASTGSMKIMMKRRAIFTSSRVPHLINKARRANASSWSSQGQTSSPTVQTGLDWGKSGFCKVIFIETTANVL